MKKQTHLHLGWTGGEYILSKFSSLGWTVPLTYRDLLFARGKYDSQWLNTLTNITCPELHLKNRPNTHLLYYTMHDNWRTTSCLYSLSFHHFQRLLWPPPGHTSPPYTPSLHSPSESPQIVLCLLACVSAKCCQLSPHLGTLILGVLQSLRVYNLYWRGTTESIHVNMIINPQKVRRQMPSVPCMFSVSSKKIDL